MKSPAQSLAIQIREVFPPVSRPPDAELTVHGNACFHCSALIDEFKDERGEIISPERVRWLVGELSLLSPSGFRWALPSYLAAVIADDSDQDLGEFLAYHFCGETRADEEAERQACVRVLSEGQMDCLIQVLHLVRSNLGSGYFSDVDEAIMYLKQQKATLAEQSVAGQPATRPVSKSEGGDSPQPEAEERSR
jgi:hypothetical protein